MKIKGQFIQFSKFMVLIIVFAATLLTGFSIFGMTKDSDYSALSDVIHNYTEFASVVFVAYSGNSAIEKWLSNSKTRKMIDALELDQNDSSDE